MLAGPANAKVGLDMQSIHSGETPVKDKKEGARRRLENLWTIGRSWGRREGKKGRVGRVFLQCHYKNGLARLKGSR